MAALEVRILQPREYYLPGMWIEGIVLLKTAEPIKARAIRLQFHGEEFTRFKVGDDHHSETHELINAYLTLWGLPKKSNDDTPTVQPGSYAFPFCVQVPAAENLPCTYADGISHVRYTLKSYIDIPYAVDVEAKCPIQIASRRPLTAEMLVALELSDTNEVGCCCCDEGVVRGKVRLNRSGVHNGEALLFTTELTNRSQRVITGLLATVTSSRVHRAHGYTKMNKWEHTRGEYSIVLRPGESFTNLNCMQNTSQGQGQNATPNQEQNQIGWNVPADAPNTTDEQTNGKSGKCAEQQNLVTRKENEPYQNQPFSVLVQVPPEVSTRMDSKLIKLEHHLAFRAVVDGVCSNDFTVTFPITLCNTPACTVQPIPSLFCGSQFARSGVALQDASKGEFCPLFSFDGLDYNAEDQFKTTKTVSYPVFVSELVDIIPTQLKSFSPAVYHLLTDGVLPQPAFVPIALEQLQLASSSLKQVVTAVHKSSTPEECTAPASSQAYPPPL